MKRISKNTMEKKDIFAPLATGLGATRRAAMLLLVMMLTATTAWAQSGSCGDNLAWRLTARTLTISGSGVMYDYDLEENPTPWSSYADQINEVVIGNGVTSIGIFAFSRTGLTSIEIPASVTSIGVSAFFECESLTSVTFAEGSRLESIGNDAFDDTGLTSIEIPASVTSIGNAAFFDCQDLTSVTFAEGSQLESIGNNAFQNCHNLTSITIPASVTSIGKSVFEYCENLATITVEDGNKVYDSRNGCNAIIETSSNKLIAGCKNTTIPASVTSIGVRAFLNCCNLTSITIPASVTSIGMRAFLNCHNLATVTVYAPSCSLGEDAFANCGSLTNIYVFSGLVDGYQKATNWSDYTSIITGITGGYCGATDHETDVVWVLTGESTNYTLTISGSGAMADYASSSVQPWKDYRSSIKTVVIGAGVTSIGNYTFAKCTGLTSINIPAGVTSIGDNAFWNCSNLATVTFAEDSQLATIGISAFSTCRGLASVEIPASVTSIGNNAFSTCTGLGSVTFAEGSQLTSIGNNAFQLCSNLTSITIPASVTSIGSYVFLNCNNLASITVEAGNTVYDSRNGCNAIIEKSTNTLIIGCKNSTIPAGVTSIGAWAFGGTGLTSIEIPASVTSIGVSAFYGCSVMTSIEIPASVTSIGGSAFYGCSGLTSIEIPAGVTSISGIAFRNCSNLATVTVYAPSCSLGKDAFYGCDELAKIYVFSDKVASYQAAENWSTYAGKITALPTVTTSYVDATGTLHEGVEAIPLNNVMTTLPAGTYVVNSDVAYTGTVTLGGDVHLILADACTMNVTTTGDEHEDYCINAPDGQSLHIYGQTEGTGALNAQTQGNADGVIYIEDGTLGIHGGNVTATVGGTLEYLLAICVYRTTVGDALVIDRGTLTANGNNGDGIYIEGGDAHINGGQVAATGASAGITVLDAVVDYSTTIPGILTLSGGTLTASGFDTYSGESYAGTLAVAAGHTYTDGTSLYDSTTETATLAALGGKTLRPCYSIAHPNFVSVSGAVVEKDDNIYAVPGASITLSPATGYTLSDVAVNGSPATDNGDGTWSFTMPAENVTVSAVVTTNTYKVHYDKNSEYVTGTMDDQDFTYGVSQQLRANAFSREGYTFVGWNTEADGSGTGYDDVQSVQNLTTENNATVTLYAQWAAGVEVTYIDADGTEQNVMAIPIDGSQTDYGISSATNWYVVSGEVNLDHLHFYNDFTHLILADGARLTANSNTEIAVRAQYFTIYAQSNGTGQIIASSEKFEGIGIGYGNLTINGGNVTATGGEKYHSIYAGNGIITINNGNVTAIGSKNNAGIDCDGITINGGSVTATGGENYHGIHAINFTIKGGNVTATGGKNGHGIYATDNGITINGGNVTATGGENGYGIYTIGGTALAGGTTLAGGTVMASSYYGKVKIKAQLYYTDGTKVYQSTLNNEQISYIAGKTMQPALRLRDNDNNNNSTAISEHDGETIAVALYGRTLYKDGDWNTLTLPFDLGDEEAERGHEFDGTPLEGATVKALANSESSGTGYDASTGTLTLYFVDANKIEAGVPYLVKWDKAENYDDNPTDYDITNPVFLDITVSNEDPENRKVVSNDEKVTFRGNYSPETLTGGDASNLYLGAANQLYWPSADRTINAFRGYFHVNLSGAGQVRSIRLNLGDKVTGVTLIDNGQLTIDNYAGADSWYDLQGRKLNFKPTQKGVYIYKGKKVVIE